MNRTEQRYALELDMFKAAGEVVAWGYERMKFRVGVDRCWYTPDFYVERTDGILEFVDVKGGGGFEDDALVKIKAAAEQYPQFLWVAATYIKGQWRRRVFGATIAAAPAAIAKEAGE